MERFRVPFWCAAFHAPQPHQPQKCFGAEPVPIALTAKRGLEVLDFAHARLAVQRDEAVRVTEIIVVLRDLVLEHEVIPKSVPGQIRDEPGRSAR